MKKAAIVLALLVVCSGMSFAQSGKVGVGVILGEPSGLSLKFRTSSTTAFDAGLAWSFASPGSLHLHGDFIFHNYNLFTVEKGLVALYYGIGGRVKFISGEADTRIGARIPIGLVYEFEEAPVDLFIEIVPMLDFYPETEGGIAGAIGIRYFF